MDIDQYFDRIGFTGTPKANLETLQEIHHLHPLAIPFENISSFTGASVSLEPDDVFKKLVAQGRGGYCFEQNLLLATVLKELGFEISSHAARVVWRGTDKREAPRTHMLLKVAIDGKDWIADVGFGGITMTAPLQLEGGALQATPHEEFRIVREGNDYLIAVRPGNDWMPMYAFDLSHQQAADFSLANYFVATHPGSLFVNNLVLARPFRNGRHALLNNNWVKYSRDGQKTEKVLQSPEEVITLLDEIFKVRLEGTVEPDVLRSRLADVLPGSTETD